MLSLRHPSAKPAPGPIRGWVPYDFSFLVRWASEWNG